MWGILTRRKQMGLRYGCRMRRRNVKEDTPPPSFKNYSEGTDIFRITAFHQEHLIYLVETFPKVSVGGFAIPGKHILFSVPQLCHAYFPAEHLAPSLKIHPFFPSWNLPFWRHASHMLQFINPSSNSFHLDLLFSPLLCDSCFTLEVLTQYSLFFTLYANTILNYFFL